MDLMHLHIKICTLKLEALFKELDIDTSQQMLKKLEFEQANLESALKKDNQEKAVRHKQNIAQLERVKELQKMIDDAQDVIEGGGCEVPPEDGHFRGKEEEEKV